MRRFIACRFFAAAAAALFLAALAPAAHAWSHKEHIQFTRLAAMRIIADPTAPQDLKDWLKANTVLLPSMEAERDWFLHQAIGNEPEKAKLTGLCWWVTVPDIEAQDRSAPKKPPFGQQERLNHYIDLEFFNPVNEKKTYQLDLSSLPALQDIPRDFKDPTYVRAGYLPLAREDAYKNFVAAVRAGKLGPDKDKPDDQDHAVRWCAYLAHYTQDNTQPHHATMDFKSGQYFKGMKNSPNVHAEMEYRMADEASQPLPELRAEYWPLFEVRLNEIKKDDVGDKDIFESTIAVAMDSYKNLPLIGQAAAAAVDTTDPKKPTIDTTKFFHFVGTVDGREESVMEMKAHQTAWAVIRTENVIKQAWAEAKKPQ
jgi:hypothetical protein